MPDPQGGKVLRVSALEIRFRARIITLQEKYNEALLKDYSKAFFIMKTLEINKMIVRYVWPVEYH